MRVSRAWAIVCLTVASAIFTSLVLASGGLQVPTSGWITQLFLNPINYESSGAFYDQNDTLSYASYQFHHGTDISDGCTAGVYPIYALAPGTVALAQYIGDGYGSQVAIDYGFNVGGNNKYTYAFYSHMGNRVTGQSYILVRAGDSVNRGQLVGYQGNNGNVWGNCPPDPGTHLDWEVRVSTSPVACTTIMRYQTVAASPDFYMCVQLTAGDPAPVSYVNAGQYECALPTATPTFTPSPTATPTSSPTQTSTPTPTLCSLTGTVRGQSGGYYLEEAARLMAVLHGSADFKPYLGQRVTVGGPCQVWQESNGPQPVFLAQTIGLAMPAAKEPRGATLGW